MKKNSNKTISISRCNETAKYPSQQHQHHTHISVTGERCLRGQQLKRAKYVGYTTVKYSLQVSNKLSCLRISVCHFTA